MRRIDQLRGNTTKYFRIAHEDHFPHQNDIEPHSIASHDVKLEKRNKGERLPYVGEIRQPDAPAAPMRSTTTAIPQPEAPRGRWRPIVASIPILLFCLWYFWRLRRRRMLLERLQSAGAPRVDRIVVRAPADKLFAGPAIRRAMQSLRLHRQVQARDLNVPATLRETLQRAGMFAPVYRMRKTLPEYLFLIERIGAHDEQARIGDEIYQRMRANDVFVDRYYFQNDPRSVRGAEWNSPLHSLGELAARHPEHRLLIFSEGAGMISPLTGESEPWIEALAAWEHRAFLTPEPVWNWGEREDNLSECGFWVLPVDR
jgi:hypothetical protein